MKVHPPQCCTLMLLPPRNARRRMISVQQRYRLSQRRRDYTHSRGVVGTNNPSVVGSGTWGALLSRTLLLPPRTFPANEVQLLWRKAVMKACYTSAQKHRDYLAYVPLSMGVDARSAMIPQSAAANQALPDVAQLKRYSGG